MFYDRLTLFEITGVHVRSPCLSQVKRFISFRRVASKSKSTREAGQSCSPFGKKKKCKDKYLAKHSSSKYLFSMILYHMQCIFSLRKSSNNNIFWKIFCSCDSVVEHCVNSAKGYGFDSQGTHILTKNV